MQSTKKLKRKLGDLNSTTDCEDFSPLPIKRCPQARHEFRLVEVGPRSPDLFLRPSGPPLSRACECRSGDIVHSGPLEKSLIHTYASAAVSARFTSTEAPSVPPPDSRISKIMTRKSRLVDYPSCRAEFSS